MLNRKRGFTLVETVVSLLIVSIGIMMIELLIPFFHQTSDHYYDTTHFYVCMNHLENQNYEIVDWHSHGLDFYSPDSKKEYHLERKGSTLLLTGETGGYMPIMDGIKSVHWQYHHSILKTRLKMKNGRVFYSKSYFRKVKRK